MNHDKLKDKVIMKLSGYIYIYILNVFKILGGIMFTGEGWDGNDL